MSFFGIFFIALIMAFAFSPYKRNNPVGPLIILFMILLLTGFAAHYWIIPFGPTLWGISWLPVLVMMFAFGLLFSAPPRHIRRKDTTTPAEQEAGSIMGVFVWLIFFILLVAVVVGIYNSGNRHVV